MAEISVLKSDIRTFRADVAVFKHAQAFYGADRAVAEMLPRDVQEQIRLLKPGHHSFIETGGRLQTTFVLFLGVDPLNKINYTHIREFGREAIETVSRELPSATHICMTLQGVGIGLDEREAFLAQIGGILDGLAKSLSISKVTILEVKSARAERLQKILTQFLPSQASNNRQKIASEQITAGTKSDTKPHVFVAMPFSEEFDDTFAFGIQTPVNAANLLCERMDMSTYTGDVLDRMKLKIETASLVLAELSGANANVYLEVGYAWGKNRPTLFIAKQGEDLKFDVRGHRCIFYKNILDLSKRLSANLKELGPAVD